MENADAANELALAVCGKRCVEVCWAGSARYCILVLKSKFGGKADDDARNRDMASEFVDVCAGG